MTSRTPRSTAERTQGPPTGPETSSTRTRSKMMNTDTNPETDPDTLAAPLPRAIADSRAAELGTRAGPAREGEARRSAGGAAASSAAGSARGCRPAGCSLPHSGLALDRPGAGDPGVQTAAVWEVVVAPRSADGEPGRSSWSSTAAPTPRPRARTETGRYGGPPPSRRRRIPRHCAPARRGDGCAARRADRGHSGCRPASRRVLDDSESRTEERR